MAVLVSPVATQKYRERSARRIGDIDGPLEHSFDARDVMLDAVRACDIRFGIDAEDVAEPWSVQLALEAQGLRGDGRTPLVQDKE